MSQCLDQRMMNILPVDQRFSQREGNVLAHVDQRSPIEKQTIKFRAQLLTKTGLLL